MNEQVPSDASLKLARPWWFRASGFVYGKASRFLSGRGLSSISLLKKLNVFLSRYFRSRPPEFVYLLGNKFYIDKEDSLGLSFTDYERGVVELIKNNLREGDVFIDIGANIGYFTVIASPIVSSSGKVYSFEPDRENFSLLQKNILANGFKNVISVKQAVSDVSGKSKLFLSKYNMGDHRTYDPEASRFYSEEIKYAFDQHTLEDRREFIEVGSVTLDEYFRNQYPNCFIKIDVQGAEGAVLRGARALFTNAPQATVVMEFWPNGMKLFGIGADETFNMLKQYGFSHVYRLEERSQKWEKTTLDLFQGFFKSHERLSMNVCFSKREISI